MKIGTAMRLVAFAMLIIAVIVFVIALSSPTVTGPAFMHYVFNAWVILAIALLIASIPITVVELKKRNKK